MKTSNRLAIAILAVVSLAGCETPPMKEDGKMADSSAMSEKSETTTMDAGAEKSQAKAQAPAEMRITTEERFRELVVGKKLVMKYGHGMSHPDGTLTGLYRVKGNRKAELTGNWTWEGEYYCRSGMLGADELPWDCLVVIVKDKKVTFIRGEGKGQKTTHKIESE